MPTIDPANMPVLHMGMNGGAVVILQQLLGDMTADGKFGQETWYAVKAYQTAHGLPVTEVVDKATWQSLVSQPPEPNDDASAAVRPQLSSGMVGAAVAQLQMYLGGLTVDGHFGAQTLARVKAFQAAQGLPQTGTVDTATWAAAVSRGPGATTDGLGIDPNTTHAAVVDGHSLYASMKTGELYLLRYDPARGKVLIAAEQKNTTFGGCNKDGCFSTPSGSFPISRQAGPGEVSHEYADSNNQPAMMPFTNYIRFGHGGIGVHYDAPAASHDCVHVFEWWLAKYLLDRLKPGEMITIAPK